jgi:hypothetical protein
VREPGNGIDSLSLADFCGDLQILDNARLGSIHIGDHDFATDTQAERSEL